MEVNTTFIVTGGDILNNMFMGIEVETMLRLARRRGLPTDADLARLIGVSPQRLGNWKRRGAIPPRQHVKVATALCVTVEQLTTGKPASAAIREAPGAYDINTISTDIKSLSPGDLDHVGWLVTRLLNAPPPERPSGRTSRAERASHHH